MWLCSCRSMSSASTGAAAAAAAAAEVAAEVAAEEDVQAGQQLPTVAESSPGQVEESPSAVTKGSDAQVVRPAACQQSSRCKVPACCVNAAWTASRAVLMSWQECKAHHTNCVS